MLTAALEVIADHVVDVPAAPMGWLCVEADLGNELKAFIIHELAKVVIFQQNNFSVYELYQYEYVPKKDSEILKIAETEAAIESQGEDTP